MKKVLVIFNSVLLAVNILVLGGLLWFENHNATVAYAAYARVTPISHQQNELESLNAELAAQKQAQQQQR